MLGRYLKRLLRNKRIRGFERGLECRTDLKKSHPASRHGSRYIQHTLSTNNNNFLEASADEN